MTDYVEAEITEALFSRIDQNEWSIPLEVSYPGVVFTPKSQPYLDVNAHFNNTLQASVSENGLNRYYGFLRVSAVMPHGSGILEALRLAAEVVSLFKRGTSIPVGDQWLRVLIPPSVADPLETSGWIRVPVTIRWQLDHPNVT